MEQIKQIQKYYDDTYLFVHPTKILQLDQTKLAENKQAAEKDYIKLLLQENIFHPQGGGQPDDEGSIELEENQQFKVDKIENDRHNNRVYLLFAFQEELNNKLQQIFQQGTLIKQIVDQQKRIKYAQLHSGGHFLDQAVKKVGLNWLPGKGYHFIDGSYVEYIGKIEGKQEEIQKQIQQACDQLFQQIEVDDIKDVQNLNQVQLKEKLGDVPEYLKNAESVRYVKLNKEDPGCPCGGTHVNHIKEIGQIVVGKIQKKGQNVRVSYTSSTYQQSLKYLDRAEFNPNSTTAILMMNLGGPNSSEEITPFLVRFFSDSTVIRIPFGLGPYIAKLRGPAKANKQYGAIGGFSPLLNWTLKQGEQVKIQNASVLPAFRYGLPLQEDAIEYAFEKTQGRIKKFLLFSQYPQYSCSTGGNAVRTSIELLEKYKKIYPDFEVSVIDRWHDDQYYIQSLAEILLEDLQQFDPKETIVLFTAHSLPSQFVWEGEYYPYYIYESCKLTIKKLQELGINVDFNLSYQSRVGFNEWLKPNTVHTVDQLIKKSKYKNIVLSPMGFTSDHLETLYELDIELMHTATKLSDQHGKKIFRARSLNTHPTFIKTLNNLAERGLAENKKGRRQRCIDCRFEQCNIVNEHNL